MFDDITAKRLNKFFNQSKLTGEITEEIAAALGREMRDKNLAKVLLHIDYVPPGGRTVYATNNSTCVTMEQEVKTIIQKDRIYCNYYGIQDCPQFSLQPVLQGDDASDAIKALR